MIDMRKELLEGRLLIGTMISELRNPNFAYLLAEAGFDYFILDNEHGAYSPESVSDIIAGARGAGIPVIVRIPEIKRETILKPLDSGAAGLLVPQVNTAEQAREVIRHAKYPPMGNRGVALRRAHNRYGRVNAAEYLKLANEQTFISVQAETPQSVENLDEIAAVEGIDSIFVGPMDLSVSLGIPGQFSHEKEVKAIDRVVEVCKRRGLVSGIQMFDVEALKPWIEKGMRFVNYGGDISMLADAARNAVEGLKGAKR